MGRAAILNLEGADMAEPDEPNGVGRMADDELKVVRERFVSLWGRMGSSWGIPRSMAEVHALLFIEGRPMNTDEVMEGLGISRGNASMMLRSLIDWGIVSRTRVRGDRKEYFQTEQDVWQLFRVILRQRKKREIDPLLEALHECREAARPKDDRKLDPEAAEAEALVRRLDEMLEFMHLVDEIAQRFIGPTGEGLEKAAKLLGKMAS